jgi:hypothetical protein
MLIEKKKVSPMLARLKKRKKLKKEDILKYGTKEEVQFLKEMKFMLIKEDIQNNDDDLFDEGDPHIILKELIFVSLPQHFEQEDWSMIAQDARDIIEWCEPLIEGN